jgi:hypothetical protein
VTLELLNLVGQIHRNSQMGHFEMYPEVDYCYELDECQQTGQHFFELKHKNKHYIINDFFWNLRCLGSKKIEKQKDFFI